MEAAAEYFDAGVIDLYLQANRWEVVRGDARRSIWEHYSGQRVFIPARSTSDASDLLRIAVREIAQVEGRDEDELALDLAWRQFDKLHVRRKTRGSALGLTEALDLHGALQDTIVAAARAASEPRASFSGRRPVAVEQYIDRVRVVASVPGSFVVRALLPLDTLPDEDRLPLVGPAAPKVRRISTTLLRAAAEAVRTAEAVAGGSPLSEWQEAVPLGVSSNLCDALSRLTGPMKDPSGGDVELRITWTWAAPEEAAPLVEIPRGLAPVIAAGGDLLRGEPEEHTIRLVGLVTKLHREHASGPGEVTVRGHIENWDVAARTLRFELDQVTYHSAIAAHDAGISVRVTALVQRTPHALEVVRIEDFHSVQ